jgi:ENTS family enterobactin (siderophore) exporter
MPDPSRQSRSQLTLVFCTVLHTFTHAYGAMLVPLYLLMTADLHLRGVQYAALLVTIYGVSYMACSYGAGVLADRVNRKDLLGWGLVLNALAIVAMGLTRRYEVLVALAVAGGLAGTLFHPAANALIPAHFPKSPGMAIGMLGIGSGLGFFIGPQYAGWRALHASWHFASVANWQKPCIELGAVGVVCGLVFLLIAREAPGSHGVRSAPKPLGRKLCRTTIAIALTLGARDFSGVASISLVSIYLQKAQNLDAARAGFIVGMMMLIGVVANPLAVWISPGRLRLPMLTGVLMLAGVIVSLIPFVSSIWVLPVLCAYQACQLGSYAMSDAAMLERVPAALRGRIVGLFLTLAGTAASTSPWIMGFWTDSFGARASQPRIYLGPFILLGACMWFAVLAMPLIAKLGEVQEGVIEPMAEILPRTMEAVM